MTTAWAHLPNARHIDAVLAAAKARPEKWRGAWDAARDAALTAARDTARAAARYAAWYAAWGAARDTARAAAWAAIAALVAWDSSADLMECTPDVLRAMIEDRKSTRLNSSHIQKSRMPSSA